MTRLGQPDDIGGVALGVFELDGQLRDGLAQDGVDSSLLFKPLPCHQPLPSEFGRTVEAYRALETLLADGKARAIGVSNFMVEHLTALLDKAAVVPAVNQIEVHPSFTQAAVQAYGAEHGILGQAWSPIGGITFYRDSGHISTLHDPVIGRIAAAHGKTAPTEYLVRAAQAAC